MIADWHVIVYHLRVISSFDAVETEELVDALERIVIGSVGLTTRALSEAAPRVELTFPQWRALLILGEDPGGYRVGEVASRVGVTLPATSRLLRRLERRGLVTLSRDELDHRATRARLTTQGVLGREQILEFRRAILRGIATDLGPPSRPNAVAAINRLAAAFDRFG